MNIRRNSLGYRPTPAMGSMPTMNLLPPPAVNYTTDLYRDSNGPDGYNRRLASPPPYGWHDQNYHAAMGSSGNGERKMSKDDAWPIPQPFSPPILPPPPVTGGFQPFFATAPTNSGFFPLSPPASAIAAPSAPGGSGSGPGGYYNPPPSPFPPWNSFSPPLLPPPPAARQPAMTPTGFLQSISPNESFGPQPPPLATPMPPLPDAGNTYHSEQTDMMANPVVSGEFGESSDPFLIIFPQPSLTPARRRSQRLRSCRRRGIRRRRKADPLVYLLTNSFRFLLTPF